MAAFVPPSVAAGVWHDLVLRHPIAAAGVALAYEFVVGVVAVAGRVGSDVLGRWEKRAADAVDGAAGRRVSRFDRAYRDALAGGLRYIDLKGVPTITPYAPELDEVFVHPHLVSKAPHQVPAGLIGGPRADTVERQSLGDFLDRRASSLVVLLGGPGSGKTTLVRFVAKALCGRRRAVPVLIPLRDHAAKILAEPGIALPALIRATLGAGLVEPAGWFEQRLRDGACTVLLDGLDEVADAGDRRRIADWIEAQAGHYSRNDFVITARPQGYLPAPVNGATVLHVHGFDEEQVTHFLKAWYTAVLVRDRRAQDAGVRAAAAAEDLLDRLAAAPALRDLVTNPLLLTMIVIVDRHRGALPGSRARLYAEICTMVLWSRAESKRLPTRLSGDDQEALLRVMAFAMMRARVTHLPHAEAVAAIRPVLRRISTAITAERFLGTVFGSGLVAEPEPATYAFVHHTFQEYLAAAHIRETGDTATLVGGVDDLWWQETTVLFSAGADIDALVVACLESSSVAALSLAFECVAAGGRLAPELRARLERMLESAFTADAEPDRRRSMVGVLVRRNLNRVARTRSGSSVCLSPVTNGIYWLYESDTFQTTPGPGSRADRDLPITGVRGTAAWAVARWLSEVTGVVYRLPTADEVLDPAVSRAVPARLATGVTASVWLDPAVAGARPTLFVPPGAGHPHAVARDTVADHVRSDIADSSASLVRLLVLRAAVSARVLFNGIGQIPVLDMAADVVLDHLFDLCRTLRHAEALDTGAAPRIDIGAARVLAEALNDGRQPQRGPIAEFRSRALDLVAQLDTVVGQACAELSPLDRALLLDLAPARVRDQGPYAGSALEVEFEWRLDHVMGGVLAAAAAAVLRADTDPAQWPGELARTLIADAGMLEPVLVVPPDELVDRVLGGCARLLARLDRVAPGETRSRQVVERLVERVREATDGRDTAAAPTATAIRVASLCLAAECRGFADHGLVAAFQEVAAGITLVQRRASGVEHGTETIVLASG